MFLDEQIRRAIEKLSVLTRSSGPKERRKKLKKTTCMAPGPLPLLVKKQKQARPYMYDPRIVEVRSMTTKKEISYN